jgi:hypothetical protein
MAQGPAPRVALPFRPEFDAVRSDAEVSLTFNLDLQAPEMREEATEGAGRSAVSLSSVLDKSASMYTDVMWTSLTLSTCCAAS